MALITNDQQSVSRYINWKHIAGVGHTLRTGDANPFTRKDPPGFILKDLFITKDMTRQRALSLQKIPNILKASGRGAGRIYAFLSSIMHRSKIILRNESNPQRDSDYTNAHFGAWRA
jgi:hypothetical protein